MSRIVYAAAGAPLPRAWIGVDLCTLVLAVLGSSSHNATTQRSAFVVLGPIANVLLVPLPLLALVTGVAIPLGTPWKLFRHYWVTVSLLLTTVAAAAVLFALRPRLLAASDRARFALDPGAAVGMLRQQVIVASSIALLVLCAVTAINVYNPWGRISRTRGPARGLRSARRAGGLVLVDGHGPAGAEVQRVVGRGPWFGGVRGDPQTVRGEVKAPRMPGRCRRRPGGGSA